jgi:WD40 repeat protein
MRRQSWCASMLTVVIALAGTAGAEDLKPVATLGDGVAIGVSGVAFSGDGAALLVGGAGGQTYDTKAWKPANDSIQAIPGNFAADGKTLAANAFNAAAIYDFPSLKPRFGPIALQPQPSAIRLSPDGKVMAAAAQQSNVATLYDATTGKVLHALAGEKKPGRNVTSIDFSPDGKTVCVGYWSGDVALWDAATGKLKRATKPPQAGAQWCVRYSPDGALLTGLNEKNEIVLLNATTLAPQKATLAGHTQEIRSLAFAPSGKSLVSCSVDGSVRIWDVKSAKPIREIKADHRFTCVAVSPAGDLLAAGTSKNTVIVWPLPAAE